MITQAAVAVNRKMQHVSSIPKHKPCLDSILWKAASNQGEKSNCSRKLFNQLGSENARTRDAKAPIDACSLMTDGVSADSAVKGKNNGVFDFSNCTNPWPQLTTKATSSVHTKCSEGKRYLKGFPRNTKQEGSIEPSKNFQKPFRSGQSLEVSDCDKDKSNQKVKGLVLPDPLELPIEKPTSVIEVTGSPLKNMTTEHSNRRDVQNWKHEVISKSQSSYPRNVPPNCIKKCPSANECPSSSCSYTEDLPTICYHNSTDSHHCRNRAITRDVEHERNLKFSNMSRLKLPIDYLQTTKIGNTDARTYTVLFQNTTCYDLMPESTHLITLDSQLSIAAAFRALCLHTLRAAPVWDSSAQTFSGTLEMKDFLRALRHYWQSDSDPNITASRLEHLEHISIDQWINSCSTTKWLSANSNGKLTSPNKVMPSCDSRSLSSRSGMHSRKERPIWNPDDKLTKTPVVVPTSRVDNQSEQVFNLGKLTCIGPDETLYNALRMLKWSSGHRLSVYDNPFSGTGNPLFVVTHRSLLDFLHRKQENLETPEYLKMGIREKGIGTYNSVCVITDSTTLQEALLFYEKETISILPVVKSNTNRCLMDIFGVLDIITLIITGTYLRRDMTVKEVIAISKKMHKHFIPLPSISPYGPNEFAMETCLATDSVQFVIDKLMNTGYHRLIVVNNYFDRIVMGMVSISDLLNYMVLGKDNLEILPNSEMPEWRFMDSAIEPKKDKSTSEQKSEDKTMCDDDALITKEENSPKVETLTKVIDDSGSTPSRLSPEKNVKTSCKSKFSHIYGTSPESNSHKSSASSQYAGAPRCMSPSPSTSSSSD